MQAGVSVAALAAAVVFSFAAYTLGMPPTALLPLFGLGVFFLAWAMGLGVSIEWHANRAPDLLLLRFRLDRLKWDTFFTVLTLSVGICVAVVYVLSNVDARQWADYGEFAATSLSRLMDWPYMVALGLLLLLFAGTKTLAVQREAMDAGPADKPSGAKTPWYNSRAIAAALLILVVGIGIGIGEYAASRAPHAPAREDRPGQTLELRLDRDLDAFAARLPPEER